MKKTVNNYASYLREHIPIPAAIARYCPDLTPRRNRIPCPIHAGQDYNLGFNDSVYHCFVCGAGGDVIHFAQQLFGLKYHEAVEKLDRDFALGLGLGEKRTLRQIRDANQVAQSARTRHDLKVAQRIEKESAYWMLLDEWIRLDYNRRNYAPHSPDEPIDDRYVEALHKIDRVEYALDTFT